MEALLTSSSIPYTTPASTTFPDLQKSYSGVHNDKKPDVVVLPESSEQLAAAVKHSVSLKQDVVVRGGGHDSWGRWTAAGATLLDLRNHNSVTVDAASQTARVAGGATHLQVLQALKAQGFQAACGACGTVGYAGWALIGGYGPFMHSYGLGADQIVGAKVVNAQGELVEADARLLKGLRGGGSSLGVVAELVIKIYPLTEIQAGMLIHDSSDMRKAITTFYTGLGELLASNNGKLHNKLAVLPGVIPIPGVGPASGAIIVWNGPKDDESKQWIQRIAGLAPLMPGLPDADTAIAPATAYDFVAHITSMLPSTVVGSCHTSSADTFSPDVVAKLAESAATIPTAGFIGGLNMHIVRAECPSLSADVPDSVLPYRRPHIMFELLGFGADPESAKPIAQWALDARNALTDTKENVEATYVALTSPEFLDLPKIYGPQWAELNKIKAEVDPANVFKHSVPSL